MHDEMWDGITYTFSNLNASAIAVWEWISDFIPHFLGTKKLSFVDKKGSPYSFWIQD